MMDVPQHHTWLVNRVAPSTFYPAFRAVSTWAGVGTITLDLESVSRDAVHEPGLPGVARLTLRLRQMTQPAVRRLSIAPVVLRSGLQFGVQTQESGVHN